MNVKWDFQKIKEAALKYKNKSCFKKNNRNAYLAAIRQNILNEVCDHMKSGHIKYTDSELKEAALKYKDRKSFYTSDPKKYKAAINRNILSDICDHMPNSNDRYWTYDRCKKEALKYKNKSMFRQLNNSCYVISKKNGYIEDICKHMDSKSVNYSSKEVDLLSEIKAHFPKATKLMDRKVNIEGKPHIKGFEIDIYIPELRKGIEFDGDFFHSFKGLKRARPKWSDEDIKNYHSIKDEHFMSRGIELIHIKEKDWNEDREKCIEKCFKFLNIEV